MRKGVEIMERLTMRNRDGSYSQPTHTTFEAMFYRLAEFEDFMEEVGAESLDEIENCIVDLNKENQTLKGNWAKLREFVGYERMCVDDGFQEVYDAYGCVLDKMRELESADGEL